MQECIRGFWGRIRAHNFKEVYNETEEIPSEIIESASRYRECGPEAYVLEAGKIKNKKYIMTYCKNCGFVIKPNQE